MTIDCTVCYEKFYNTRRSVLEPFVCSGCEDAMESAVPESVPDATGTSSCWQRTAMESVDGYLFDTELVERATYVKETNVLVADLQTQLETANTNLARYYDQLLAERQVNDSLNDSVSAKQGRIEDLEYRNVWQSEQLTKLASVIVEKDAEITNEKTTNHFLRNKLVVANDTVSEFSRRNETLQTLYDSTETVREIALGLSARVEDMTERIEIGKVVAQGYLDLQAKVAAVVTAAKEQFDIDTEVIFELNQDAFALRGQITELKDQSAARHKTDIMNHVFDAQCERDTDIKISRLEMALSLAKADADFSGDRWNHWKASYLKMSQEYSDLMIETSKPWGTKAWEWLVKYVSNWRTR